MTEPPEPAANHVRVRDLVTEVDGRPLNVPLGPPLHCAAREDRLHLVGTDLATETAIHVTLDATGALVGPVERWPLRVAGIAAAADGLVATASRPDGGPPLVCGIDDNGEIRWQAELTTGEVLSVFPRPIQIGHGDDGTALVWVTGTQPQTIWMSSVSDGTILPAVAMPLDGVSIDLDIAGGSGEVTITRVAGYPPRLDLLRHRQRWTRSSIVEARQPATASIGVIGPRAVVAWTSMADEEIHVQMMQDDLSPPGPIATIAEAGRPSRIHDARFISDGTGHLAIHFRTRRPTSERIVTSGPSGPGALAQPGMAVEQFVVAYDWQTGRAGTPYRLGVSRQGFGTAGWVGSRLVVLHGDDMPLVTVLTAQHASVSGH